MVQLFFFSDGNNFTGPVADLRECKYMTVLSLVR